MTMQGNTAQCSTAQGIMPSVYPLYEIPWGVHVRYRLVLIESEGPPQLLELPGKVVTTLQSSSTGWHSQMGFMLTLLSKEVPRETNSKEMRQALQGK